MKYTWGLLFLLLLPIHTRAIDISFANITETTADLTVDWSDGTVSTVDVNDLDLWAVIYDRLAGPFNFINIAVFTVVESWPAIHLQCSWQEPPPTTLNLAYYNIWTPDFATVTEQSASSITFHLDRNPEATEIRTIPVPDAGSSMFLMLGSLTAIWLFRHRFAS